MKYLFIFILTFSTYAHANSFDFLAKKYPGHLKIAEVQMNGNFGGITAAQEEIFNPPENTTTLMNMLNKYVSNNVNYKEIYKESFASSGIDFTETNCIQRKNFTHESFNEILKKFHPLHGYYNLYFNQQKKEHSTAEDFVLAAEYLQQKIKDIGDKNSKIVFLGRSPSFIQTAFECLQDLTKDHSTQSTQINFSGHPDIEPAFNPNMPGRSINPTKHLVTPDRLNHYFAYLDSKNILSAKRLFIVDIIESGAGLNSFISLLNTYYETRNTPLPDIRFMCITYYVSPEFELKERENFKFTRVMSTKEDFGQNNFTLTFNEDKQRNIKPHILTTHLVPIRDYANYVLDIHVLQEAFSPGFSYPSLYWHPQFDAMRNKGGPLSGWARNYLKKLYTDIIDNHLGIMTGMSTRG